MAGLSFKLTLDDSGFQGPLRNAINGVKQLQNELNNLGSNFGSKMSSNNNFGNVFMKGLKGFGLALGITEAARGIKNFEKSIIENLKNYEYFSAQIRVLMHGDILAADALKRQLITLAKETPFNLEDVQKGSKQLLSYGFTAGEITKNLNMLGDIAAGTGVDLTHLIQIYGKTKIESHVFLKDINSMTRNGIPIIDELGKAMGKTKDEVLQMVKDGKVGFSDIKRAMENMTGPTGQFSGMMEQMSKTVGGQLEKLADNWDQLQVKIGQSQTGILNKTITWMNSMVETLNQKMETSNFFDKAMERAKKLGVNRGEGSIIGNLMGQPGRSFEQQKRLLELSSEMSKMGEVNPNYLPETQASLLQEQRKDIMQRLEILKHEPFISPDDRKELKAIFIEGLSKIAGAYKLLKSGAGEGKGEGAGEGKGSGKDKTPSKTETVRENVTINIHNLVEGLTISTTNLKESSDDVKKIVGELFQQAVYSAKIAGNVY